MQQARPWHEDDSFWQAWEPLMFTPERLADTVGRTDQLVSLLELEPEADVLDLCCGIGRYSLEFARRGFRVTGVDRTAGYLERAGKQAAGEGLDIEFVHEDMRRFSQTGSFDAALSMYTSFGYFEDPEEDRRVVENVLLSLKPGGRFVIQMHGKETLAKIFRENDWFEAEDGTIVLHQRKVTDNWSWMENRWIIIKGTERHEDYVTHRLYSGSEIAGLLSDCGFSRVRVYGDLDGSPYDQNARQQVTVGYK